MGLLLSGSSSSGTGIGVTIIYLVLIILFFYFFLIRPSRKEEKNKKALLSRLEIGDSVLTSSGFYGVVIDIADDTVIVEFGQKRRRPLRLRTTTRRTRKRDSLRNNHHQICS